MSGFLHEVNNRSGGSVAALFNIFSGGALENCAVFSLGIMPYISASIMLQLLTAVVPQLGKLAREDGGPTKNYPVHALRDRRALYFSRLPVSSDLREPIPEPVSHQHPRYYQPLGYSSGG